MTYMHKVIHVEPIRWTSDLSDGAVLVRHLAPVDAPAFVQAFKDDPALGVMIGTETDPTEDEVVAQAEEEPRPGQLRLAIVDATTLEFMGVIGLYRMDLQHRRGEVGFWLTAAARGRGLGTRAVRLLTGWAFETLGFNRVELTTTPDNAAARRLAQGLGFKEEGTMRERNVERGHRVDVMMLAVLKDEWRG
jgi:[ribosomal protein S5]-alanine N-acetyltransferase